MIPRAALEGTWVGSGRGGPGSLGGRARHGGGEGLCRELRATSLTTAEESGTASRQEQRRPWRGGRDGRNGRGGCRPVQ